MVFHPVVRIRRVFFVEVPAGKDVLWRRRKVLVVYEVVALNRAFLALPLRQIEIRNLVLLHGQSAHGFTTGAYRRKYGLDSIVRTCCSSVFRALRAEQQEAVGRCAPCPSSGGREVSKSVALQKSRVIFDCFRRIGEGELQAHGDAFEQGAVVECSRTFCRFDNRSSRYGRFD